MLVHNSVLDGLSLNSLYRNHAELYDFRPITLATSVRLQIQIRRAVE